MKTLLGIVIVVFLFSSCDDDHYHDSGLADGKHDCSMWEYMKKYPETWDSVALMIERANLKPIFDGIDPDYPQITFFGPTNYSVMAFLFKTEDEDGERLYRSILEIPEELCRQMVLSYIIPKRMMKSDFDYEVKGTLTGGTVLKTMSGIDLRIYRIKTPYKEIPDIGPEELGIHSLISGHMTRIASANIQTTNGVVHSLSNGFEMVKL